MTTVEIPGGTAELYGKDEMTARRRRPTKVLFAAHAALIQKVATAASLTTPDGQSESNPLLPGGAFTLTEEDVENLERIQDAATVALLKSWTLDRPLPTTPDALLDLPDDLYEALRNAISTNAVLPDVAAQFEATEEGLTNPDSPTGDSGLPNAPLPESGTGA